MMDYEIDDTDIHVGPSDYVPWLKDRKWCHIRMEGTTFGEVPLNIDMKLEVWDSPNSAGVVIDAVRCAKLALDNGLKGALIAPSAYFKKSPPVQFPDDQARIMVEEYIKQYGKKGQASKSPQKRVAASRNGAQASKNGAKAAAAVSKNGAAKLLAKPKKKAAGKKKAGVR